MPCNTSETQDLLRVAGISGFVTNTNLHPLKISVCPTSPPSILVKPEKHLNKVPCFRNLSSPCSDLIITESKGNEKWVCLVHCHKIAYCSNISQKSSDQITFPCLDAILPILYQLDIFKCLLSGTHTLYTCNPTSIIVLFSPVSKLI